MRLRFLYQQWLKTKDTFSVYAHELKRVFTDPGVVVIFLVATLVYPILYRCIYYNDYIQNIPVAVVDECGSSDTRAFLHKWDACPDVRITHVCASMQEAEKLLRAQKVHGIIYFPSDFTKKQASGLEQAHISLYCDMSSFLYMKGIFLSCNQVMLETMRNVQIDRYEAMGMGEEMSWILVQGAPYTETALFTPTGGYASFLIPAVLMLIIHQTLLFGICMLGGTAREENNELYRLPGRHRGWSVLRITFGRAAAYFTIYLGIGVILLIFYPVLLNIPHIGNVWSILKFYVPYLLATIFFSMAVSVFVRNRESGMVLMISSSLIFLFIAGVSWPQMMLPKGWLYLSYILPYTWGVHGYLHLSSMGASMAMVGKEYTALWILAGAYALITCVLLYVIGYIENRKASND